MAALPLTPEVARVFETPEYRVEGPLKVTGRARYTSDVRIAGMLWAKFLHSPFPHARIVSIDTSAAKAVPGVHAVLTAADIGERRFGRVLYDWPVLAFDRVRFVGERVVAVAAETREAAELAVSLVRVEYEELPAIFEPEDALREGAPVLHPDPSGYHYGMGKRAERSHPNMQGYELTVKGDPDIEAALSRAYRVFEDEYSGPHQHQGYIEPHACVVWPESDGTVRVYSTNKSPFGLRNQISVATGVPAKQIVVDSMFIGGDFGGKGTSIDEFPCVFLAQATGRPVRAVMTYADELAAVNPRHPVKIRLRTGVDPDGRIVAHHAQLVFNGGAYGAAKPMPNCIVPAGPTLEVYNVPNVRTETTVVYTNTVPCGHMRAPGSIYSGLAGEGHVEHIAREMGIDPLEFRLLNALRPGDTGPVGESIHNPKAVAVLEAIKGQTNWGAPKGPNRGRGISLRHRHVGTGKAEIVLHLLPDGKVEALYGTPDQGSGSSTVVRRVAAAVLSIEPEQIMVRYGTTNEAPLDGGSGASRVTHVVGRATIAGATNLKQKLEELAAEVMGWPAGEVKLEGGKFTVGDGSGESAPYSVVAERIARTGPVEAFGDYDSNIQGHGEGGDFNFYAYVAEVEVDPITGEVRPIEVTQVVDVGTIINPIGHEGQLQGSFVFGLGNAIMEELVIEEGRFTTLSLGEYKLPTQMDIPALRTILVRDESGPGPFGAKAAGEITNSGLAGAIANAVYDAVGVRIKTLPVTAERVYEALQARGA